MSLTSTSSDSEQVSLEVSDIVQARTPLDLPDIVTIHEEYLK